jgi:NTP pyrophosphatase (non-canonical NTP hydrolase)
MAGLDSEQMTVLEFEANAAATDQLGAYDQDTAVLGLVGEVGSLVSALKKKRRDTDGFYGYHDTVVEELGDVIWYVSAIARRSNVSLADVVCRASGSTVMANAISFSDFAPVAPTTDTAFEASLLRLAGEAGDLAKRFAVHAYRNNPDALRGDLIKLLRPLAEAAAAAEVSLEEAARFNVRKREDRWPISRQYPPLLDDGLHIDEQIPRSMRVLIYERNVNGTDFVFLKFGDMLLGDRLTDNHLPADDFRFHDVFHLAHASVLGWSPTIRALLKIKRKSIRAIDENEDGARANLIEEGLTTWIFETAKQHRFFANTPKLGLDLLKDVKRFVRGYEAEQLPMWLWESAIIQGYAVFRQLQVSRHGVVCTDMDKRKIWFEAMSPAELQRCGLQKPDSAIGIDQQDS